VRTGPSPIAGVGWFAVGPVAVGAGVDVPVDELNHSCDPALWFDASGNLVARRALVDGDELTVDYATVSDDPLLLRCNCGTYRCRQLVEGDDWTIPELRTRYDGHWSPAVQRRISQAAAP